jgi:ketosteroid isomerase-like protein
MKRKFLILAVACALPAGAAAQDSAAVALDSLRAMTVVEAEQAFARAAAELGMRAAFLAHLADDAVVFTPRATDGQEAYGALAESSEVLQWEPAIAESSMADDLGYTTGPYTYRSAPDAPVSGSGWYLSVWQRKADGVWKVVLDLGTPTEAAAAAGGRVEIPARTAAPTASAAQRRTNLLALEQLIADVSARGSAQRAILRAVDVDARHNDAGTLVRGGRAVARTVPDTAVAYEQLGHGFSQDADMAYTYGEYTMGRESSAEPDGNWVRIWRMQGDGQWYIVHMVTAPIARAR